MNDRSLRVGLLSRLGPVLVLLLALDAASGTTLWHTTVGANQTNGAITYELDGKQYVVVGAGDTLIAFALANAH